MIEETDEIQLGNPENIGGSRDQDYSRSMLLMKATSKILEAGSREMKKGFYIEKRDKFGNIIKLLTDDTRRAYCEAVRTLRDLQTCDFDSGYLEKIEKIEGEIESKFRKLLLEELNEFTKLSKFDQQSWRKQKLGVTLGSLNIEKRFYERYVIFELKKHRELFQVLTEHSKEKDFYKKESIEG